MDDVYFATPLWAIFAIAIVTILGASEVADRMGRKVRENPSESGAGSTLSGAALGLLALLIAFSFSIALTRYEDRREAILGESLAVGSTVSFTALLPQKERAPIYNLLREYTEIRVGLGIPYDPDKLEHDVARSIEIQNALWERAGEVATAKAQSLPVYQFVASLNDLTNAHERRITTLRVRLPFEVVAMLLAMAMVAMGFVGFQSGSEGKYRLLSRVIMSITIAALITLIVDLDRPARGLINLSPQPLVDVLNGIPK